MQPENPESPVDGEAHHGNSQDEKESLLDKVVSSEDPAPESLQGRDQSPIPGSSSCDGANSPPRLHVGLTGLDPLIPHGQDFSERPMGDMGSNVAPLQSAGAHGSWAPCRTGHRSPERSRFDVSVPLDRFPILLDGEFHGAEFPDGSVPSPLKWIPLADEVP